jgi:hypothetical protein
MFGDPSVKTRAGTNVVYDYASIQQAATRGNGLDKQASRRDRPEFLARANV